MKSGKELMKIDWLIIGGGIHGVHIAARLLDDVGVDRDRIRIIDPCKRLLQRWRECTAVTGMVHLRSPAVHHLGLDAWSLRRYAQKKKKKQLGLFAPPYERPALTLFNAHCDRLIDSLKLDELHLQARATHCRLEDEGAYVELSTGEELSAKRIVLAMGSGEAPAWPTWAPQDDPRVSHVFEANFDRWPEEQERVMVIGGGISAGQIALRLVKEGHRVHLVSRHEFREHQFDSDPGWLGPKYMKGFSRERDVNQRRSLITEARHKGSVPPDVLRGLRRAIQKGSLSWYQGEVESVDGQGDELTLQISTGDTVQVQRILLATGFSTKRPGGSFVDQLVQSASLPCAHCGYPIVDEGLRWHPRLHVSGPLAELEIGPSSRNIAGARRAGDRIVATALAVKAAEERHQTLTEESQVS